MTAPYVKGSATSKAASLDLDEGTLQEQEQLVIAHLRKTGGSIDWDTWCAVRRTLPGILLSSVHRARIGLTKKHIVRNSGRVRTNGASGKKNMVWELGAGEASVGSSHNGISRPNPKEWQLACDEIIRIANEKPNFSNETWRALVKMHRWLVDIAP